MTELEQGFWQAHQRFLKTPLLTEQPHPATANLAELAKEDLLAAYGLLQSLDLQAIDKVLSQQQHIESFKQRFLEVLKHKGRIIIVGCGASGRIAAQIEYWWRMCHPQQQDSLKAVLAGGDVTLIEAIESCEDNPEFARKQMAALQLSKNDSVIGLSASGEAAFIVAALRYAESHTLTKPVLICCNPIDILLERDQNHLAQDAHYEVLSLTVGAMALTCSTRMQATTAITLFLLLALLPEHFRLKKWQSYYKKLDFSSLCSFTEWEAQLFLAKKPVSYHVQSPLALTVLSDLTERAPTFNIPRLMHQEDSDNASQLALVLDDARDALDAWTKLLGRSPQALNFKGFTKTRMDYLLGFNLSQDPFKNAWIVDLKQAFPELFHGLSVIESHFLLRVILVNHSTLAMGRCGFYVGNLMTFLKPANAKLIDRAIRYVQFLAEQKTAKKPDYEQVASILFDIMPRLQPGQSIVLEVLQAIPA